MTPSLKFSAGNHQYRLDGKHVKGVTTLIKEGLPAPALTYWAGKFVAEYVADNPAAVRNLWEMGRGPCVAALKEVPWQKRDDKAARGTDVHRLAEKLVHGAEVEIPEGLDGFVDGYVRFLDLWQPVPLLVEAMGANREHWYAGTLDLVADMAGYRWLLDVKTAKSAYGKDALQCDAYRHFEFWQDTDGQEQPMPEGIERLGVLHVREDGTDLIPLESTGKAFEDFLKVAAVAKAAKSIEGHVGAPLPYEVAAVA